MNVTELFWAWAGACVAKDVDAIADLYCTDATHAFPFRDGTPVIEGRRRSGGISQKGSGGLRCRSPQSSMRSCTISNGMRASIIA